MECPICSIEVAHLEEHHIVPREYGGEKLHTISICSTCHHGLHHQANSLWAEYHSKGKLKASSYFTPSVWNRAKPYVSLILEARSNYEQIGEPLVQNKRLILNVPRDLLQKLHKLKKYHGYTSLERYVIDNLKVLVEKSL